MAADPSLEPSPPPPPFPEPPAPNPAPTGVGKVLLFCAIFYGFTIFATLVEQTLRLTGIKADMAVALFFELLFAWTGTLWLSTKVLNRSWANLYGLGTMRKAYTLPLMFVGVGLSILLSEAASLIPMPDVAKQFFVALFSGNRVFMFLGICVMAPIMEEFFFRGFVFRSMLQRYNPLKAMWISAGLFALFHLNPWQAVVAFPIGMFNAWLVLRTGGLIAGMIVHCTVNFCSSFLLTALGQLFGFTQQDLIDLNHMPWQMMLIGIVCAAIGLVWTFKLKPAPTVQA